MINTLKPADAPGHDEKRNDVLERISREYGKPEEKQREAVKKLGKDEFFKIMVTQIQHQDPMKPYENEQMAAQMAQFSALEQMMNVNQNLEKLTQAQQPLHNMGAAGLIGKYVSADSSRLTHTEGKYSDISFELPADAQSVRLIILNDRGENVREIEKDNLKKGPVKIEWDGKGSSGFAAKSGQYMVQVSASTAQGKNVPVKTAHTSVVHGVAYEGKETVLLTGDVTRPQKLLLKNVYKIVDANQAKAMAEKPQIAGLPEGFEITGLENLINGAAGGQAAPAAEDPMAKMIDSADRNMENYNPGLAGKYDGASVETMKRAQALDSVRPEQGLSTDQIRKMLEDGPDLTGHNPVAEAIRAGRARDAGQAPANMPPTDRTPIDAVNPAARDMGYGAATNGQKTAAGQAIPSSADGSTAGYLAE